MSRQKNRYNCPWDTSNQNKSYTKQEKRFIKKSYENGVSLIEIAKAVKRGLWAIEVQTKYYLVKKKYQRRPTKHEQKQKIQQNRNVQQKQKPKSKKKSRKRNKKRKVKSETQVVVKTSEGEFQDHIKELMGLNS